MDKHDMRARELLAFYGEDPVDRGDAFNAAAGEIARSMRQAEITNGALDLFFGAVNLFNPLAMFSHPMLRRG